MAQKTRRHYGCSRVLRAVRRRQVTPRTIALAQRAVCETGIHRDLLEALAAWNPARLPRDAADWAMLKALR